MRCDDDYAWGGCYLHGAYNPEASTATIAEDFLSFCLLAVRSGAVPKRWDWAAFLKVAATYAGFAFEKSDAQERWGSENVFEGAMGGRSLRYTGTQIYRSEITDIDSAEEHLRADRESHKVRRVWGDPTVYDSEDESEQDRDYRYDSDEQREKAFDDEMHASSSAVGGPTKTTNTFDEVGGSEGWVLFEQSLLLGVGF